MPPPFRPEDDRVRALLEGGARLVTVHGLPGMGSSTLVSRVTEGGDVVRIDLSRSSSSSLVRARLARVPRHSPPRVFLDQAHAPGALRRWLPLLLSRSELRIIVASRAPLGLGDEHPVGLAPLDDECMTALLEAELRRLDLETNRPTAPLVAAIDGWPLALRAMLVALRARVDPSRVDLFTVHAPLKEAIVASLRPLSKTASDLADLLSRCVAGVDSAALAAAVPGGVAALDELGSRGLVVRDASGTAKLVAPVAAFVRVRWPVSSLRSRRASSRHAELILGEAEVARAHQRQDPERTVRVLERLRPDLFGLASAADPATAVRAAVALEPHLSGLQERGEGLAILHRARRLSPSDPDVVLALGRTLLGRGEHESAEALLNEASPILSTRWAGALRLVWLGHIAAWRGDTAAATERLDEAERLLDGPRPKEAATELERLADVAEDLLLQRVFVAFCAGDFERTERQARMLAEHAARRSSKRVVAAAMRFVGEVRLAEGRADEAAALFRRSRDDLRTYGDHAGALFFTSRLAEALARAGEVESSEREAARAAELAAHAEEGTLELTLLTLVEAGKVPRGRVADLVWRIQIPAIRHEVERWLRTLPAADVPTLAIDARAQRAELSGRSLDLSRRPVLWRVLGALVAAHTRQASLGVEALFRAGWPNQRVATESRRKRVQTAIWTLRRDLLGAALLTHTRGYALAGGLRVVS